VSADPAVGRKRKLPKYLRELEHAQEVSLAADLCDDIARRVAKKVRQRSQLLGVDPYVNYSLIAKHLRALRPQIQEPSHPGSDARCDYNRPPDRQRMISKVIRSIRFPSGGKDPKRKRPKGEPKGNSKICEWRQRWAKFIRRRTERKVDALVTALVSKSIHGEPSISQALANRYVDNQLLRALTAEIERIVYEYQHARVWGDHYIPGVRNNADPNGQTKLIQFPERLMNLLVLESVRDKRALREFLALAFQRWRQHDQPNSTWRRRLAVYDIAAALARPSNPKLKYLRCLPPQWDGGVQASGKLIFDCLREIGQSTLAGHLSINQLIRQDLSRSVRQAQRARSPFRDKILLKPFNLEQETA
jgi:hypothetical protein